jgi:NitT/TauT family transport system substrate-binding protein/putative hydroxymethylpyrimidine transport system substrate-binding protein
VHGGLYQATTGGVDRDEGLVLTLRTPGSSTDAVKLLAAGQTDFAVLDIHDLGLAREKGADLVGVFALVQRPLAAVIARPIVRGAGGDPGKVETVTIGFNAVPALLGGRVDAATAFWNAEGVALRARRPGFREFRLDDYGAPRYPELVVAATRRTVQSRGELVRRLRRTLRRSYAEALAHPARTVDLMRAAVPGLDLGLLRAQLAALRPAQRPVGRLDRRALRAWAAWEVRVGILKLRPDVEHAFLLD